MGSRRLAKRTLDGRVVTSLKVSQWIRPGASAPGLDAIRVAPYGIVVDKDSRLMTGIVRSLVTRKARSVNQGPVLPTRSGG